MNLARFDAGGGGGFDGGFEVGGPLQPQSKRPQKQKAPFGAFAKHVSA